MARSEGFEPPAPRFEVWCSIQLSYERSEGRIYGARRLVTRDWAMWVVGWQTPGP